MDNSPAPAPGPFYPELEPAFWKLYRDFFDKAERNRRWNIRDDIPWNECNDKPDPIIAHVVESFCAVELYLPDYTSKILPVVRNSMGRTWFYANWGYEESKHSLVLEDWLLRSGARTEEQIADVERNVLAGEWNLPHDSHLAMLIYAMVQEQATWLNYRNLKIRLEERAKCPALSKVLLYLSVDEKAHGDFFRRCVQLYLEHDRPGTLDQLKRVMKNFAMPAIYDMVDSQRRIAAIRELDIFSEELYFRDVYFPVLEALGVKQSEMRGRAPKKSDPTPAGA
jgi:acyl-[acyl-carrier-protein] desaturase